MMPDILEDIISLIESIKWMVKLESVGVERKFEFIKEQLDLVIKMITESV